jgi:hypothetical protein
MIVRRLPDSELELYHHGIMGMRWGVRRFQNKDGTLTSTGRKRRGLVEQIKYNRKMKKVRRAKVEKAKEKQRKAEELQKARQKSQAERKERAEVIKTGSAKDIQKFQHKMSDKEYEQALQRVKYNQMLTDMASDQARAKAEKTQARLNTVMTTARTIGDIASSAANVYTSLERMGIIKHPEKENTLQKLQRQADIKAAKLDIRKLDWEDKQFTKNKKVDELRTKKDTKSLELDLYDLKMQAKEQKNMTRPDELSYWKREADITKAMAEVAKNNRTIAGEDAKKISDFSVDELANEIARRTKK